MYKALWRVPLLGIKINSILEIFISPVNLDRAAFSINGIYVFRFSLDDPRVAREECRGTTSRFHHSDFIFYNRSLPEYRAQLFAIVCCYISYNIISYIHIIIIHTYSYSYTYLWRLFIDEYFDAIYEIAGFSKYFHNIHMPIYILLAFLW